MSRAIALRNRAASSASADRPPCFQALRLFARLERAKGLARESRVVMRRKTAIPSIVARDILPAAGVSLRRASPTPRTSWPTFPYCGAVLPDTMAGSGQKPLFRVRRA